MNQIVNVNVREAEIRDIEKIAELWKELSINQLKKDEYYNGTFEFYDVDIQEQIKSSITNSNCGLFIVEYKNDIQGFVEVWINSKENFQLEMSDVAYIVHYYIKENRLKINNLYSIIYRLFNAAEEWAKEKKQKYLVADVYEHNQKVIRMLEIRKLRKYKLRMVRKVE